MSELGLFDVPDDAYLIPPAPEELTRGERRKRLIARRIANGEHPLGKGIRIHAEAATTSNGLRCGTCKFRETYRYHDRSYPKCRLPLIVGERTTYPRDTGCESSDIRRWWPACRDYQAKGRDE